MSSITATLPGNANRRRRVRHKIQTPAYAIFSDDPNSTVLDLHEIVDISEDGVAIQHHSPLETDAKVKLCLDLSDCPENIYTYGQVVWSNATGRAGLRFSDLPGDSLARLREWLFVNVMAGVANGEAEIAALASARESAPPRPSYTDTLSAVGVVQRQVESLGADRGAALKLIAERAQSFVRASGCAIALAEEDADIMVCRASSGEQAPPVGSRLHVGSGFSGECVKSGALLRSDDTETDTRVDLESCRALGIRSILAAPVRSDNKSIGLIEAFSEMPNAFSDVDGKVFQKLADTIFSALNRATRAEKEAPSEAATSGFTSPQGSVLFAAADEDAKEKSQEAEANKAARDDEEGPTITLPRSHIAILISAAGIIALVLGYLSAPLIQTSFVPWFKDKIQARSHVELQTVLASSTPDTAHAANTSLQPAQTVEPASIDQLRQMAEKGSPAAQNAMGLRYATGEGVKLDEAQAVAWFLKSAEQGYIPAQSKLGSIYFSGRGVPQDTTRAYFWMVVARLSGDEASKTLSPFVRARLTRAQVTSIELEADRWLQQHSSEKPPAGQLKARN